MRQSPNERYLVTTEWREEYYRIDCSMSTTFFMANMQAAMSPQSGFMIINCCDDSGKWSHRGFFRFVFVCCIIPTLILIFLSVVFFYCTMKHSQITFEPISIVWILL